MILNDMQIQQLVGDHNMIDPFVDVLQQKGVISYGLSSFGYDIRVSDRFKIFSNAHSIIVDPKKLDPKSYVDVETDVCIIPPNSFVLSVSIERMRMPDNVIGVLACKSTYIRAGMHIPSTVLEPGWEGYITLELANLTPLPVKVYANEGIAQILFYRGNSPAVTYASRNGKYQNQKDEITLPHVE